MNIRRQSLFFIVLATVFTVVLGACAAAPEAPRTAPSSQGATAAPAATTAPRPTTALATQGVTAAPAQAIQATAIATAAPASVAATSEKSADSSTPSSRIPDMPTAAATPVATETPVQSSKDQATPATVPALTATASPAVENRLVELEWPEYMRLGDSDIVRIALIPSREGYTVSTEFAEHQTVTSTVQVHRPAGYDLSALGRLDGVGFDLSPQSDQVHDLPAGETVTWRWTLTPRAAGQQRLVVSLMLRWTHTLGSAGIARESLIFSKGLTVNTTSLLGMTTNQAATTGLIGLVLGSSFGAAALVSRRRPMRAMLQSQWPNPSLVIEQRPGLQIQPEEATLLKTLFRRYARLVVESEFLSGYSGARTLLALPIRSDGRADAYTIAKIGDRESIRREFDNYETFVKDTLPPITARIQEAPVTLSQRYLLRHGQNDHAGTPNGRRAARAVLRYTFIGEPGRNPISLREALLAAASPDPTLLNKLFATFGPNWWMQRRPYMFRLAQEYDRVLPAHFVIEPASGKGRPLDAQAGGGRSLAERGDLVALRGFSRIETRMDGKSLSLAGEDAYSRLGRPALRVRWLSTESPNGATGRVVSDRAALLREYVAGFDLCGLADPLPRLQGWLDESVRGSQSTIHGDLNLENILVGPGGFVWLIDFAQTREGHVLYDFAHLEAEVIAQIIARQVGTPGDYLSLLRANDHPLLTALHDIAANCLTNPAQPREYTLALCLACVGALKFNNLQPFSKHLLYLTAAHLGQTL